MAHEPRPKCTNRGFFFIPASSALSFRPLPPRLAFAGRWEIGKNVAIRECQWRMGPARGPPAIFLARRERPNLKKKKKKRKENPRLPPLPLFFPFYDGHLEGLQPPGAGAPGRRIALPPRGGRPFTPDIRIKWASLGMRCVWGGVGVTFPLPQLDSIQHRDSIWCPHFPV